MNKHMGCHYEDIYASKETDSLEKKARRRRVREFKAVTGLKCVEKRTRTHKKMYDDFRKGSSGVSLDHETEWDLDGISFLLTEPYDCGKCQLEHKDYVGIKIPLSLAPYCGKWTADPDGLPSSHSYLFAPRRFQTELERLRLLLEEAAKSAPRWNYIPLEAAEDE